MTVRPIAPISRRQALTLGGLGLAGTLTGGLGLAWQLGNCGRFAARPGAALREPPTVTSAGGVLDVTLDIRRGPVALAGRQATVLHYNGGVPGPTLRVRPGDRLAITLVNHLDAPTNLHTHGLHVSPQGTGDNPFRRVEPGESARYEYALPASHPPGVFWYHPHLHGTVAAQVSGGLYGAIIVDDPTPVTTVDRVLVISDVSLAADGTLITPGPMDRMMGREGDLVLVNGQATPQLSARPGERQRWRIVNACAGRYLRLRLDGHQLDLIGIDGAHFSPQPITELALASGNRADILVTAGAHSSQLRALPYARGGTGMGMQPDPREHLLADLLVDAPPVSTPALRLSTVAPRDLRSVPVSTYRQLRLSAGMGMGMGMMGHGFTIDGRSFDSDRVDQSVRRGSVEEWSISNDSPMDHPLHLHVWPMQIVEHPRQPVHPPSWQDVVNIPARSTVRVRIAFDDFVGRTVYHCHILDHEDNGMMGVVEVS